MVVNIFTYIFELLVNFKVRVSQYQKTVLFYCFCTVNVVIQSRIGFVMLISVQFNHQSCFRTKEVNNIGFYDVLSMKTYRITPQKIIPKMVFFFGRILS